MTCTVDGCYAKAFSRNLCRNHFYAWRDQLPTAEPGPSRKGTSVASPAPTSYVCTCTAPIIMPTGMFPGAVQCQRCGKPPIESLSRKEPT